MLFFKYKNNNLFCENIKVSDICKKFETPFYLYSSNALVNNYNNLDKLLKGINYLIAYSVKANSNISVLKTFSNCGAGADVVSIGELKKAIKAGISSSKIVYSGVGKSNEEIAYALKANIEQFNVESLEELETISLIAQQMNAVANIALRVNPDITAGGHPKISTGKKTDKFGIPISKSKKIYKFAKELSNINIKGVDIHIGSQISNLSPFKKAFKKVLNFCMELDSLGFDIKNIDLGGGIGIDYESDKQDLKFLNKYVNLIKDIFKKTNKKIIIEPGRFLVANAGILVTKVLYKKIVDNKNFLIIDAGMNDLMRPALYDAKHLIKPLEKKIKNQMTKKFEVVGTICETADVMVKGAKIYKTVKKGDFYFIDKTGAYGHVMSSSYNSKSIASEVMINKNDYTEIKKRINTEDLLKFEKTAAWLRKK
ncbi:MAG: diaminopimelate decarboxylase [Pelagibacterales bacterium]|nr:diaminopimelate decarboxylase [Pelagibacterales bacterium]OUU63211.1 MAG: diaminopimelate decarboxylase [Alphaproteobacteria bacterium TMED62]|tara:strand:- start:2537 stop:3814 length:1278 start_codon:yes stop_codon:yes gene_type:complete